jgi:predicted TPR repeat methyltransferase
MSKYDALIRRDGQVSKDGETVGAAYDAWASDYDAQLVASGYEAPARAAGLLGDALDGFSGARILDCGCGTGMTGQALRDAGAQGEIIGLDASAASLDLARAKGCYTDLRQTDLNATLPVDDGSVDGLLCIGTLTYLDETVAIREWTRVLRPGGVMVFTSRDDFFRDKGIADLVDALAADGTVERVHVSGSLPYLPGSEEFGTKVQVIYVVLRKPA